MSATYLVARHPSAPLAAARTILAVDPRGEHALSAHACLLRHGRDDEKAESLLALRLRTDPAEDVVPLLEQFFELQVHPGTPVSRDLRIEALVTLATLGYGDYIPRTDMTRGLVVFEAIGGQLFLAVMVARLIGLYTSERKSD